MQNYECKVCGALIKWSPEKNTLYCDYCGTVADASQYEDATASAKEGNEGELVKEYTTHGQDLPDDCVLYKCSECGAEVIMSKTTMQTECVYCGQAINVTEKTAGKFRAEYIIPYTVDENTALANVKKHYRKCPLLPFTFTKKCKIENLKRLFVPYYLYDAHAHSDATLSYEETETEVSGNTKQIRHELYHIDIAMSAAFEKVPVDGSTVLGDTLMDGVEPFDYSKIKNFNPAYMAGYFAEQPDTDDTAMTEHMQNRLRDGMAKELKAASGREGTAKIVKHSMSVSDVKKYLTMMPVYYMFVTYKGERYPIVVNGQSGKVSTAVLPGSYPKLAAILGIVFGVAYLACHLFGV